MTLLDFQARQAQAQERQRWLEWQQREQTREVLLRRYGLDMPYEGAFIASRSTPRAQFNAAQVRTCDYCGSHVTAARTCTQCGAPRTA